MTTIKPLFLAIVFSIFSFVLSIGWVSTSEAVANGGIHNCLSTDPNTTLLKTAANNVYSFGYVKSALNAALNAQPNSEICFTGVALNKNIYQYYKFLIQFQIRSRGTGAVYNAFNLLYQDASTQANHNFGKSPWIGLEPTELRAILEKTVADDPFVDVDTSVGQNPIHIAQTSALYKKTSVIMAKAGFFLYKMPSHSDETIYLVSWMIRTNGGDLAGFESPKGVLVKIDKNGRAQISERQWLMSGILFPLEDVVDRLASQLTYPQYHDQLLEFSRL